MECSSGVRGMQEHCSGVQLKHLLQATEVPAKGSKAHVTGVIKQFDEVYPGIVLGDQ